MNAQAWLIVIGFGAVALAFWQAFAPPALKRLALIVLLLLGAAVAIVVSGMGPQTPPEHPTYRVVPASRSTLAPP